MDSKLRLETALTRLLTNKAKKTYDSTSVRILIPKTTPHWKSKEFERCIEGFNMPKNPFEQIWLLPEFDGSEPPIRIF